MKKCCVLLLCAWLGMTAFAATGSPSPIEKQNLRYTFDYSFKGHITGVFLLVFRYRFFFYARASVILEAIQKDERNTTFHFLDIAEPGLILRTKGFRGKTLITGVASFEPKTTDALLEKDHSLLKSIEPEYYDVVKQWLRCPFLLESKEKKEFSFSRSVNGIHSKGKIRFPAKRLCEGEQYRFDFKIYPMMLDLVKTYDHEAFTGNVEELQKLALGDKWQSAPIDLSEALNNMGRKANSIVEKHVKFKQKEPFSLNYRVTEKSPEILVITGTATPHVKIWGNIRLEAFTRTLRFRLPGGLLLEDSVTAVINKGKQKVGSAACSLSLMEEKK